MKYFITLSIFLLSNLALSEGRIEITTEDQDGIRWLDLHGVAIPASYGMELEIFYSNGDLSIVDANLKKSGPQIQKGDFFSESAYEISNNVDVRKGRIRYAISLLKPAEPIAGDGHLARIGFTSKTNKAANIELANIKFGTQSGKIVEVAYPAQILIEPAITVTSSAVPTGFKPSARRLEQEILNAPLSSENSSDNNLLIIGLLSLICLLFLVVIALLLRRRPLQAS
jgi:hypothetical protein